MSQDKSWINYTERYRTYPQLINEPVDPRVKAIVCIPVCAEPDLLNTIESLSHCTRPDIFLEVILLFNKNAWLSEEDVSVHDQIWQACLEWISLHKDVWIKFCPVYMQEMPDSDGGVGWARKIAIDEAASRLGDDDLIICLDADCLVDKNYFTEIIDQFSKHPSSDAASIYFEHEICIVDSKDEEAIVNYELHLRYLVHAQRWCGHPFAFYTVGSAMAVRRNAYLKQGGMNTKKAGEDFYFLQKFIETGKLFEISGTTVHPSSRISHRVPFGTGKAMHQIKNEGKQWLSPSFEVFRLIKPLFNSLEEIWIRTKSIDNLKEPLDDLPDLRIELKQYLSQIHLVKEIKMIASQTSQYGSFRKRFFRYFNAFRMIKYMHYMRDHHFPDVPVEEAMQQFCSETLLLPDQQSPKEYLRAIRRLDKDR